MHYYKSNESLIATIGVLDLPEITEAQYLEAVAEREKRAERLNAIHENTRALTEKEVLALLIPMQINALEVDDNTALRMVSYYPKWATNTAYEVGFKVQWSGKLWRALQAHTAQDGWQPGNAPALWEQINETHTGELTDPIPYEGGMALKKGKHYIQKGVICLCIRDTENPVYNDLPELTGLYVEEV